MRVKIEDGMFGHLIFWTAESCLLDPGMRDYETSNQNRSNLAWLRYLHSQEALNTRFVQS